MLSTLVWRTNVRQREAAGVDQLTRLEAEREDRRTKEGRDGWRERC